MIYHMIAFFAGYTFDLLFGDPYWLPHPVRFIGELISAAEKLFLGDRSSEAGKRRFESLSKRKKRVYGFLAIILVVVPVEIIVVTLLIFSYDLSPFAGVLVEALMTYQLLAAKCLKVESMKVYKALENGTLEEARKAVSMIVGRDTNNLSDEGVTKAAVETVAENASDGVIAPMIFLALGGPAFGFFYKCINTMDSMVGYKNERYVDFGRWAALTDDFVNWLPSRLCALLMIISCCFLGKDFSAGKAFKIWKRDRFKHESPNSAQTESTCAGALGIQLAGPAVYEGKIEEKPFLGDNLRSVEHKDIIRANRLMYASAFLCVLFCITVMILISVFLGRY